MATQPQLDPQPEVHHLTKKRLPASPTPLDLLSLALSKDAAIDVIERLAALQEKVIAREVEIQFHEALNRVQEKISRVAPDLTNPQTSSKYASYAAIDKVVRPVYTREGFSLSFDTDDCPTPEHVRAVCYVSRGGHTRKYKVDMPSDGKGARGGDVMTKTHATGAAMSYGMRYLLKYIFNVVIGEEDTDGNAPTNGEVAQHITRLKAAQTIDELRRIFKEVYPAVEGNKNAQLILIDVKDARKRELS